MTRRVRGVRILGTLALLSAGLAIPGTAQELQVVADSARVAWGRHDAASLVGMGGRVVVQLPEKEPTAPLGRRQAVALLQEYLSAGEEVAVAVGAVRMVADGAGYVELRREYRVKGAVAVRAEAVLLSYRRGSAGWELVEVRIAG